MYLTFYVTSNFADTEAKVSRESKEMSAKFQKYNRKDFQKNARF